MDAGSYVVVASNSARAESPGWYFNLCADPRVELQVGCKRIAGLALALQEGELDYDRLWRLVNDGNRGRYDGYRRRTTRPIPLVVVQPV
jgi:deazaflavin-dependent oxidoreductase (nitroreductase family)